MIVVKWRIGMYKNTMGQIKNNTDVCWGCILVECVQATCHFLRARLHWKGVYQGAHGWAIIGELQLQRKMVQSNDSLRFKLANYNCFRCKVYSNVMFRCCHTFYPSPNTIVPGSGRFQQLPSRLHGRCPNNGRKNTTRPDSATC